MADQAISAVSEVSVPALDDVTVWVDTGTTTRYKISAHRLLSLLNHTCEGRLTLESGVPVSTSDQTAKTNVYFTPYLGNKIAIYDGTRWKLYAFTELTLALGTLTAALPYDVYIYDNAGTLTLEALAWTNTTTRATALAAQDGVWCKTGALTRRYLGTFYTTATTTTEDSAAKRFVWNCYNRVRRYLYKAEDNAAATWTDTTNTWHSANSDADNAVAVVCGLAESMIDVSLHQTVRNTVQGVQCEYGIGIDSATVLPAAPVIFSITESPAASVFATGSARVNQTVPLGYHVYSWLVNAGATGTTTWMGTITTANAENRSGLTGSYWA